MFDGAGTIVNDGLIFANSADNELLHDHVASVWFYLFILDNGASLSIAGADFENWGLIDASDLSGPEIMTIQGLLVPSSGTLDITASTFVNHAGGKIEIGNDFGSSEMLVAATTDFINDGMITNNSREFAPGGNEGGGQIDIAAAISGSGTIMIDGGGGLTVESAVSSTQTILFNTPGCVLTVDQPASMQALMVGFGQGDQIILNGVSATAISYTSGDLKLQTTTGTLDLGITGPYSLSNFGVSTGPNVTAIDVFKRVLPCRWQPVATDRGSVLVEHLRVGDTVVTGDGQRQAIQWIGHRDTDCRRHPNPASVWPVRIAAHAFGHGLPRRAVLLSPDHAVFVDDVLVPIKRLVNGTTIVQRKVARVTYYHVELSRHDVLLAEGLPVESYLETGGRAAFENGGEVMQLHPNFAPDPVRVALIWDSEGYAPLVVAPRQLAPIKERLRRQAEALEAARNGPRRRGSKAA